MKMTIYTICHWHWCTEINNNIPTTQVNKIPSTQVDIATTQLDKIPTTQINIQTTQVEKIPTTQVDKIIFKMSLIN